MMVVGIDFDNTIVCYDTIFHRIAIEHGLIPPRVSPTKTAIRDYLRAAGKDTVFTELQGYVYGPRLVEAEMYTGVREFFRTCRERGVAVKIISHKTRFPYAGDHHDLHAAARAWLQQHGFFRTEDFGIPADAAFFEQTKQDKLARIRTERCDVFIDDLPELLNEPKFPRATWCILFDPMNEFHDEPSRERARSWDEVRRLVFAHNDEPGEELALITVRRAFARAGMRLAELPRRIAGGGNNRVFEIRNEEGCRILLKEYFRQQGNKRDRFESERRFYQLAMVAAPEQTPRALFWDADARLGFFEFVEGQKPGTDEIGADEIDDALEFFRALNRARGRPEAQALPAAAEACFSVEEHCQAVDQRIERLQQISVEAAIDRAAVDFVRREFAPAWAEVRAMILANTTNPSARLRSDEAAISPSDFGFHNCLRRADGRIVFVDFEYAGWDDPVKTVCDFFCQPAVPVPTGEFERFAVEVARAIGVGKVEVFVERCRALLPLYRLKWCGIMLNEFIYEDRGRRAFALGAESAAARKERQLALAREHLPLAVRAD